MILVLWISLLQVSNAIVDYSLIMEFTKRELANTLIMFSCGGLDYKGLGQNLVGSIHHFEMNAERFYNDHQRFMTVGHYRFAVVADLSCDYSEEFMNFCSENEYFNGSYRWLLFSEHNMSKTLDSVRKQNLNIDSRVTLVVETFEENLEFYDIFGTVRRRGGKTHVMKVGSKTKNRGVVWTCTTNSYYARDNLGGVTLQAAVVTLGFNKQITVKENMQSLLPPTNYVGSRMCYQIVQLLKRRLNFRTQHFIVPDFGFDLIGTNSSYGVVGKLQQNLIDLGFSPLAVTKERIGIFDQTVAFATVKITIIFRHPKSGGTRNLFLQPFNNKVWSVIGAIMLVSTGMLSVILYVKQRKRRFHCQHTLIVFGMFCLQGYSGRISIIPSRITLLTVIIFSILLYQFYSCFIIGYLLVLPPKNIRTLEQLLASNLKLSVENISYNHDFFKRTNIDVARELYERKVLSHEFGFTNVSMGISLVKQGGYAFHCDNSYGNTFIMRTFSDHEICELQEMSLFPPRSVHLNVPKGSPLKEIFRVTLRRLLEIGLAEYYQRKLLMKRPPCLKQNTASAQVRFEDIEDLCILLAVGVSVSIAILLVEIVDFRVRKYWEMKQFAKHYTGWLE